VVEFCLPGYIAAIANLLFPFFSSLKLGFVLNALSVVPFAKRKAELLTSALQCPGGCDFPPPYNKIGSFRPDYSRAGSSRAPPFTVRVFLASLGSFYLAVNWSPPLPLRPRIPSHLSY